MANMIADTHIAIRGLQEAGMQPEHAEAIVTLINRSGSQLVTKVDLEAAINAAVVKIVLAVIGIVGVGVAILALFIARIG